jgi:hypothetical protein
MFLGGSSFFVFIIIGISGDVVTGITTTGGFCIGISLSL